MPPMVVCPGELVHHHHHPMCLEKDGLAAEEIHAPKAVFHVIDNCLGWSLGPMFTQLARDKVAVLSLSAC